MSTVHLLCRPFPQHSNVKSLLSRAQEDRVTNITQVSSGNQITNCRLRLARCQSAAVAQLLSKNAADVHTLPCIQRPIEVCSLLRMQTRVYFYSDACFPSELSNAWGLASGVPYFRGILKMPVVQRMPEMAACAKLVWTHDWLGKYAAHMQTLPHISLMTISLMCLERSIRCFLL